MTASNSQATGLGYWLPAGTEPISYGDNAITQNAKASATQIIALQGRAARLENRPPVPGPAGPPGPGANELLGTASNLRGLLPWRKAIDTGNPLSVLAIGDSNTVCVGSSSRANTWPARLLADLRTTYADSDGDAGPGYLSAGGWFDTTRTGTFTVQSAAGGIDGYSVLLDTDGKVIFPAGQATTIDVYWTSSVFAQGTMDVSIDGTVVGTIDGSAGGPHEPGQRVRYTVPAGTHQVTVTRATGTPVIEGVMMRTSETDGVTLWAAGRSGSSVPDWLGDQWWTTTVPDTGAQLVIVGLGGNDQSNDWGTRPTGDKFGQDMAALAARIHGVLPDASVVLMLGAQRRADVVAGDDDIQAEFRNGLIAHAGHLPYVRIVLESELWAPLPDGADPYGWLAAGDDIHRSDFGNELVERFIYNTLTVPLAPMLTGPEGPPGPAGPEGTPQDTGWRTVNGEQWLSTGDIPDASSGGDLRIRRRGSTVTLGIDISWITSGTGSTNAAIVPVGYRPPFAGSAVVSLAAADWNTGQPAGLFAIHSNGAIYAKSVTAGQRIICQLSWLTDDPWPTTLPGGPA